MENCGHRLNLRMEKRCPWVIRIYQSGRGCRLVRQRSTFHLGRRIWVTDATVQGSFLLAVLRFRLVRLGPVKQHCPVMDDKEVPVEWTGSRTASQRNVYLLRCSGAHASQSLAHTNTHTQSVSLFHTHTHN